MHWVIKLTEEEKELMKRSLEGLLVSVGAKIEITGPTKIESWSDTCGLRDEWTDFEYKIKIDSPRGVYEQIWGLSTREGARGDIDAHALEIARQFCINVDPNLKSELADHIWPKNNP